jgi:hypothetical protein
MLIFVSHASEDARFVEEHLLPLIRRSGHIPWYSKYDIQPFADWPRSLDEAIER